MLKGGSEDRASRSSYWTARWRPYKRGMMMRRRGISDRSATTCGSVWRWSRGWGTCIMTMPTRKPSKWQNSVGNCSGRLWKSCPRIYKFTQNNTNVQCWKAYSWKLVCCPRAPYTVSDSELQNRTWPPVKARKHVPRYTNFFPHTLNFGCVACNLYIYIWMSGPEKLEVYMCLSMYRFVLCIDSCGTMHLFSSA